MVEVRRKRPSVSRVHMALVCAVCLIILSMLAYLGIDESFISVFPGMSSSSSGSGGGSGIVKSIFGGCKKICKARYELTPLQGQLEGDLLDRNDLLTRVRLEKQKLLDKLKNDYGEENFNDIFLSRPEDEEKTIDPPKVNSTLNKFTYRPFKPMSMHGKVHGNPTGNGNENSIRGLHRKLMIKILTAQLEYQRQESNVDGCDCLKLQKQLKKQQQKRRRTTTTMRTDRRTLQEDGTTTEDKYEDTSLLSTVSTFSKMVWATGGHSAAAGHGNLFNESYTAVMGRDVKGVFASVGIDFEARNYAMGGTGSSPEMALCFEQVFGLDVDMFSWDYGMLEAGSTLRLLQYGYRGGLSRGRPAMVGIRVGDSDRGAREGLLGLLEDAGMPVFYQNNDDWDAMKNAIPESQGLSADQLKAMPEFVRNFKCAGALETGEPFCSDEKYTPMCPNRFGKANWHPGFKWHAMVGHSIALFLVEALEGAVQTLVDNPDEQIETILEDLKADEDTAYEKLLSADLSSYPSKVFKAVDDNKTEIESYSDFDFSLLYKGNPFCHTARLPAQSRFNGYLTDTTKIGEQVRFGEETYETGVEVSEAATMPNNGTAFLSWNKKKRAGLADCPDTIIAPDYKDFFFVHSNHGPAQMKIPNEVERAVYDYQASRLLGAVIVILEKCDWGNCENGFLTSTDLAEKKWSMNVNGAAVDQLIDIGYDALLAKPANGRFFPPQGDGTYDFKIQVNAPDSYIRISSIVVL